MIILSKGGQGVEDAFQLSFVFTSVMASTAFSHALDWKSFHAVKAYILSHALLPRPGGFSVALSHNPPPNKLLWKNTESETNVDPAALDIYDLYDI